MNRTFLLLLTTLYTSSLMSCIVIGDETDQPLLLRNFDYPIGGQDGYGMITHNPKGYKRQAILVNRGDHPLTWESKYASVSFNLLAPGTPQDGLNEAGLAGTMAVARARYHRNMEDNSLPSINEMEFLQWILDRAATRDEVVHLLVNTEENLVNGKTVHRAPPKVRLTKISKLKNESGEVNFHWVFCDAMGDCVEVDYVDTHWELRLSRAADMVMTNDDSDLMETKYRRVPPEALPLAQQQVNAHAALRYYNARYLREHRKELKTEAAEITPQFTAGVEEKRRRELTEQFHLLDRTTMRSWNKWQIVYAPAEGVFYYRTEAAEKIKKVPVMEIIEELSDSTHATGLSVHTSYDAPLTSRQFKPLHTRGAISDVFTIMRQSPRLTDQVEEHFQRHEKLNESRLTIREFIKEMERVNRIPLIELTGEQPSQTARVYTYSKMLANKSYYTLVGTVR